MSTSSRKIRLVLAGSFPAPGTMTGTFGRIRHNIMTCPIFQDHIDFTSHGFTIPQDGAFAKRWAVDMVRITRTLAARPDVFHMFMNNGRATLREFPAMQMARAVGARTVLDIRAGDFEHWMTDSKDTPIGAARRHLLRVADEIVAECPRDVELLKQRFGRTALHLPNIMPEAQFRRVTPALLPPQDGQPLKLIYSGRYLRQKGLLTVFDGLDLLAQRGRKVEFHLTGGGTDAELQAEIARQVANPRPGVRVVDHGWDVPDLLGLLGSAHVFVMLTTWPGEGHPNSLTEAMTAGLGCILSDWRHRTSVIPEEGHRVVPADSAEAFAQAVEYYLDHPDQLQLAGQTNRRFVEQHFLDTLCYPRLLETWQRAAARK